MNSNSLAQVPKARNRARLSSAVTSGSMITSTLGREHHQLNPAAFLTALPNSVNQESCLVPGRARLTSPEVFSRSKIVLPSLTTSQSGDRSTNTFIPSKQRLIEVPNPLMAQDVTEVWPLCPHRKCYPPGWGWEEGRSQNPANPMRDCGAGILPAGRGWKAGRRPNPLNPITNCGFQPLSGPLAFEPKHAAGQAATEPAQWVSVSPSRPATMQGGVSAPEEAEDQRDQQRAEQDDV